MNISFEQHQLMTAFGYHYFMNIKLPENMPSFQTGDVYQIF